MPRLFGTDGIRGIANVDLKPTLAYALGRATAHRLAGQGGCIVVGQDTRRSGDMFVAAIVAGATSLGVDVHIVGVVPTPALAHITGAGHFAAGIMVSASHNPARDNGLKVLDEHGLKLDDDIEDELEQFIWRAEELPGGAGRRPRARGGCPRPDRPLPRASSGAGAPGEERAASGRGLRQRLGLHRSRNASCRRPARTSTSSSTTRTARTSTAAAEPRRPAALAAEVVKRGADVGFALDGDADRLIAVDASGCVVDGDAVLGILALDRIARDRLPNGALVVSVLSNGGLQRTVEAAGGQIIRTPVGDKYILEGDARQRRRARAARRAATSSSWSTPRAATASSPRSKSWRS